MNEGDGFLGDFAPNEEEPPWDDDFLEMVRDRLRGVGDNAVGVAEQEARALLGNEDYNRLKEHHLKVDALNLEAMVLNIETAKTDIENTQAFIAFNLAMAGYRGSLTRLANAVRGGIVIAILSGIGWEISRLVGH